MFVRLIRSQEGKEDREFLLNTDSIWKIEVEYGLPQEGGYDWDVDIKEGWTNPAAVRWYKVFFGSEEVTIRSDPNDKVVKVFEDIYTQAIKP